MQLPGPIGVAKSASTEINCFDLFFNDQIINLIVTCTNIYIDNIEDAYDRERDANHTDSIEIRAFIGILLYSGLYGSNNKNTKQMWDSSKGCGVELVYLAMSRNRFEFLMQCIRFVNIRDRQGAST